MFYTTGHQCTAISSSQSVILNSFLEFVLKVFLVGMCRWENENWPIHLPNLDPKWTHIFIGDQKCVPILRNLCQIYVRLNLPTFGRFFFSKIRENMLMKKNNDPFIYQSLGWWGLNSFTRVVKIGPFFAAHPLSHLSTRHII